MLHHPGKFEFFPRPGHDDAIALLLEDQSVFGWICRGGRYDIGKKLDFLRANVELALQRPDLGPPFAAWLRELLDERGLG